MLRGNELHILLTSEKAVNYLRVEFRFCRCCCWNIYCYLEEEESYSPRQLMTEDLVGSNFLLAIAARGLSLILGLGLPSTLSLALLMRSARSGFCITNRSSFISSRVSSEYTSRGESYWLTVICGLPTVVKLGGIGRNPESRKSMVCENG